MNKPQKEGYRIIISYLIVSLILGGSMFQIFMQKKVLNKSDHKEICHKHIPFSEDFFPGQCRIGLGPNEKQPTDLPIIVYGFKIPEPAEELEPLKEMPNIILDKKESGGFFEDFDEMMEEIEDEPIPEVINIPEESNNPCYGGGEFLIHEEEPYPRNMEEIKQLIYKETSGIDFQDGHVIVRLLVNYDGSYLKHKIIHNKAPVLAQSVENHIAKLIFTPAYQCGKPIKYWVNIPFSFSQLLPK